MVSRGHLLLGSGALSLSGDKVVDRANDADSTLRGIFSSVEGLTMSGQR